jgi:uncharacterized protein (TIGR00299 family) protein
LGKTLYFDCFSGVSGDMLLGALLDLGLPLDALREALGSLAIEYGTISTEKVLRAGISSTKFKVLEPLHSHVDAAVPESVAHHSTVAHHDPVGHHDHHHHDSAHGHHHDHAHAGGHAHHSLGEISQYINRSALSESGKARARHLFERLAEAEAAIHQMPVERVHLHEVGAVDSIIDIVGSVFGLEWLGASNIVSSPLNVGSGTVRCAHGVFPVPAPATLRLLEGVPIYSQGVETELTTPTGALLVTAFAERFGPMPSMRVTSIGYGAGDKDFAAHPNVLRLMVGESGAHAAAELIVTIECEIDDMNPQLFGPLMDRLYAGGALDVYYAAVQMKKNRPGTLVTVLAPPDRRESLMNVLFTDTTTIGVRYRETCRERLERELVTIETPVGAIRFKIARRGGVVMNASPEFDDCARVASDRGLPIKEVQAIAVKAWLDRGSA